MSRGKKVVLGLVLVIAASQIVFVLAMRRRRDPAATPVPLVDKSRVRVERLADWTKRTTAPISTREVSKFVESLPFSDCLPLPEGVSTLESESLTDAQRNDLDAAISGLLDALAAGTASALIEYHEQRGEALLADRREMMRVSLVAKFPDNPAIAEMPDADLADLFLKKSGFAGHWSGIQEGVGCRRAWRIRGEAPKTLAQTFGNGEGLLFGSRYEWKHGFDGSPTFQEAARSDEVSVVDVEIVVRFDESLLNQVTPYMFRFWYDETRSQWRPLQVVRAETGEDMHSESQHWF